MVLPFVLIEELADRGPAGDEALQDRQAGVMGPVMRPGGNSELFAHVASFIKSNAPSGGNDAYSPSFPLRKVESGGDYESACPVHRHHTAPD